ncbi:MAG: hypothetical protein U0Z44_18845 [Kouleothrix sp.]
MADPLNSPQALAQPHPPIMIGGAGEQKTLRLVAQYADACNLFARMGNDVLRQKLDILKGHCDAVGRPYEAIEAHRTRHCATGPWRHYCQCDCAVPLAGRGRHPACDLQLMPNVQAAPLGAFRREIIPAVADL